MSYDRERGKIMIYMSIVKCLSDVELASKQIAETIRTSCMTVLAIATISEYLTGSGGTDIAENV